MKDTNLISANNYSDYDALLQHVGETLTWGRQKVVTSVGSIMVRTYWEFGKQIVEYEQNGNEKAEYGSDVLNRLSRDLTERYGKGFSRGNVFYMRKLFMTYPKVQTLPELLTWSHYVELLKLKTRWSDLFMRKKPKGSSGVFGN